MNPSFRGLLRFGWLPLAAARAVAEQRFSQPEFDGGHVIPVFQTPPLRPGAAWAYLDVALLAAALGLAAWLVHGRRSRGGLFVLLLSSLAYFGFVRRGCVCPVGSIQNVAASLGPAGLAAPVPVLLFFLLPLVAALLFGRVFCGSVCPLGAIQDLLVVGRIRPLPRALASGLSLLRYVSLGLGVLLAALGARFLICEHDPFVGFFRLSGPPIMLLTGGALLLLGAFVARPYCRFLCPYGVLLEWAARFAWRPVTIPRGECVSCGLCTDACPFDVIVAPGPGVPPEGWREGRRTLSRRLLLLPLLLAAGLLLGRAAAPTLARMHDTVRLAGELQAPARTTPSEEALAFEENGGDRRALAAEARAIEARFRTGSALLGLFLAGAAGTALLGLASYRTRTDFRPNPGRCLACARCYGYCPVTRAKGDSRGPDPSAG